VREKLLERRVLRDSRRKTKMKLTLARNKPGNPRQLRRIRNTVLLGGLGILIACTVVFAQAPHNSKTNQQDRGAPRRPTSRRKVRAIATWRERSVKIIDDKNLSMYAHSVKVIARGGTVTLKGSVPSNEEKAAIESKAVEIADAANVENELTVKSKTEK
jgi:osmotically-inducible protein OsmY